jgi:hypothetical protein
LHIQSLLERDPNPYRIAPPILARLRDQSLLDCPVNPYWIDPPILTGLPRLKESRLCQTRKHKPQRLENRPKLPILKMWKKNIRKPMR